MNLFESIVSKIAAANQYYEHNTKAIHHEIYTKDKVIEGNRIYHNVASEEKSKKITERELRRPWSRLGVNYKTMVILNYLREFKEHHPDINLNLVMYEMMLNISQNSMSNIKVDYDLEKGKIVRLYGYEIVDKKVVKTSDMNTFLIYKIKLNLKPKNIELISNNEQIRTDTEQLSPGRDIHHQ